MNAMRTLAAGLVLGSVFFGLAACEKSVPKAQPAPAAAAPAEHVYVVRGKIADLPKPEKPGSSRQIQHEAISDFVGQKGPAPMKSMTMPFPVAKGVSLDGLAIGDIVEFTFEVRWNSQPHSQITKIVKLPADTQLKL